MFSTPLYPTSREIARTLSPLARILTAAFLLATGFLLGGGLGYVCHGFSILNALASVGQEVEQDELLKE